MDFGEGDALAGRHHEELADGGHTGTLGFIEDGPLLGKELLHEWGEAEPELTIRVAVELEERRVALDRAGDFAAAGEAKLTVELASIIEAENLVGLVGEEVFGTGDESEEGIAFDNSLEGLDLLRPRLDEVGAGAFGLSLFFVSLLAGFLGWRFFVDGERRRE